MANLSNNQKMALGFLAITGIVILCAAGMYAIAVPLATGTMAAAKKAGEREEERG